jgi:hypothetical protein
MSKSVLRCYAVGRKWLVLLSLAAVILVSVETAYAGSLGQNSVTKVLFLDLNNAPAEVRAVARGLGSGAQIDVWPTERDINLVRRKQVFRLGKQMARLRGQLDAMAERCSSYPHDFTCVLAWERLRSLEVKREELTSHINLGGLDQFVYTSAHRYDTVVISGHHENGYFDGEIAKLQLSELKDFFARNAANFAQTRSVLLLGCDTAVGNVLRDRFKPLLPSARLFIGAEGPAPTRNESRNLNFITRVMAIEYRLATTQDERFVRSTVSRLRDEVWPIALLWGTVFSAGSDSDGVKPFARVLAKSAPKLTPCCPRLVGVPAYVHSR